MQLNWYLILGLIIIINVQQFNVKIDNFTPLLPADAIVLGLSIPEVTLVVCRSSRQIDCLDLSSAEEIYFLILMACKPTQDIDQI